jgi:hypothetical protein
MPYERAVPVAGRIYVDDIIESGDVLYESVEALVLDIQENPQNYGIMKHHEIAEICFHSHEWRGGVDQEIVIFTVCDELPDEDYPEDNPRCGMYDPEGKWWCGWHEESGITWKSRELVTVNK